MKEYPVYKDIQDHPEWSKLAKQVDDLKYALLNLELTPNMREIMQKEYKKLSEKCDKLEELLYKQNYVMYLR